MIQIVPAILATTEEEYTSKLKEIEDSNSFEGGWIQIDLMDNKFVQNKSIGTEVIAKHPTKLKVEAHLMVEYPENWIDELIKIKVSRITFPIEDQAGIKERIAHIKNAGIEVGVVLNPETSTDLVKDIVADLDSVIVMSVKPGFAGQDFIKEVLLKAGELKKLRSDIWIGIDGGVSLDNAREIKEAGFDYLVIGSHLLEGDIEQNLEKFWEVLN